MVGHGIAAGLISIVRIHGVQGRRQFVSAPMKIQNYLQAPSQSHRALSHHMQQRSVIVTSKAKLWHESIQQSSRQLLRVCVVITLATSIWPSTLVVTVTGHGQMEPRPDTRTG